MTRPRPAPRRAVLQAAALATLSATLWLGGCAEQGPKPDDAAAKKAAGPRYQDDTYRAVNGAWLATAEIPPDRSSWGAFLQLRDEALTQSKVVIDDAAAAGANGTPDQQKIVAIYQSFMDEPRVEALGAKPIAPQMRAIDAIRSKRDIPAVIAQFNEVGIPVPYFVYIGQDARDPTHYIPTIAQGGLGLPDRDYYLAEDDPKLKDTRTKYLAHIARMLTLANAPNADASARQVLELETRLARVQWTRVENRDPVKTYNKVPVASLDALTPGFDWKPWLTTAHVSGKVGSVIVAQPSYFKGFAKVVETMPLDAWKAYFKYHVVESAAPYLSKPFVDEDFAFEGGVLSRHAGGPAALEEGRRHRRVVDGRRASASCTSRAGSRRNTRRGWTTWSATSSPPTARASTSSTGWARRRSARRRRSSRSSTRRSPTRRSGATTRR